MPLDEGRHPFTRLELADAENDVVAFGIGGSGGRFTPLGIATTCDAGAPYSSTMSPRVAAEMAITVSARRTERRVKNRA